MTLLTPVLHSPVNLFDTLSSKAQKQGQTLLYEQKSFQTKFLDFRRINKKKSLTHKQKKVSGQKKTLADNSDCRSLRL